MIKSSVRNPDIVQDSLNYLHSICGLSWRKIALLDDYSGIPAGTLSSIARGYPIPRKWMQRLGLPELKFVPACRHCGNVHVSSRCPIKPPVRRHNSNGATVIIRGKAHEVVSKRRMDSRPFAPVLVTVREA